MKQLTLILFFAFLSLSAFSSKNLNDSNAIICGKIDIEFCAKANKTLTFLHFSFFDTFSLTDTTIKTKVDTVSGFFKAILPVTNITYINLKIYLEPTDTTNKCVQMLYLPEKYASNFLRRTPQLHIRNFISEPGDSLYIDLETKFTYFPVHIVIPKNNKITFSGSKTAVGNNNFYLKHREPYNYHSGSLLWDKKKSDLFDLEIKEALSICDNRLRENLNSLKEVKDSISNKFFHLTQTEYIFANLNLKHRLVRAHLYSDTASSITKRKQSRELYGFMDEVEFKDEYLISSEYIYFVSLYIEYLWRIIYGEDIPIIYYNGYYLAKAAFTGKTKKFMLSKLVDFNLNNPEKLEQNIIYYKDFINTYPTGELSDKLKNDYLRRKKVLPGAIPPNLILSDSLGRTKSLSNLKNKVIVITPEYHHNDNAISELREKYKDVIFIGLETENSITVELNEFYTDVEYFAYEKLNTNSLKAYLFKYATYTLINKEGKIVNHFSSNPRWKKNLDKAIDIELAAKYTFTQKAKSFLQRNVFELIMLFSIIISITLTLFFVSEIKKRRLKNKRMQLQGEIKALRAQLNPHFLFNSISSIQNYIQKCDIDTAINHLSDFSKLMRMTLEYSEKDFLTLDEELTYYTSYIKLEAMRHGFNYTIDIDNNIDKYNTEIPGMLLQPFIENAIIHGISGLGKNGQLKIELKPFNGNFIRAVVTDNGKGFNGDSKGRYGLKSSRERIDLLNSKHKKQITLSIANKPGHANGTGLVVELIIPRRY